MLRNKVEFGSFLCIYSVVPLIQILCSRFSSEGAVKVFGYISFKTTLCKFCDENGLHGTSVSGDYLHLLKLAQFIYTPKLRLLCQHFFNGYNQNTQK